MEQHKAIGVLNGASTKKYKVVCPLCGQALLVSGGHQMQKCPHCDGVLIVRKKHTYQRAQNFEKQDKTKVLSNVQKILMDIACFLIPVFGIIRIAKKKGNTVGEKIVNSLIFILFWVYSASLTFFIIWSFYSSFKLAFDEFFVDMIALPKVWHFSNYKEAYNYIEYNEVGFVGMFINSLWFAIGSSLLSVFMHAVTGYIFAKYNFPAKEAAFSFVLFTLALPIVGALPSMYKVVHWLHLQETPLFLVTYLGGFGSNFLIMYAYFKGVDKTYIEAADIDGAGRWCIFIKIMMPLAVPPCFSLFLMSFIGQWNNYETPMLFLDSLPTLSSGLYEFREMMRFSESTSPDTVFIAGALLASIPVIVLVACFGEKIMSNVSMGGIKG